MAPDTMQTAAAATPQAGGLLAEIGSTGLKRYGGYVVEEFHRDLRGPKAAKAYREMGDNHPLIGATNLIFQLLPRKASYWVDPLADSGPAGQEAADFVQTVLDDMDGGIVGYISEAVTFAQYGWAWMEKLWKLRRGRSSDRRLASKFDDGRWGLRRIALRSQDSLLEWVFGKNGDVEAMKQQAAPDFVTRTIPRAKAVHLRLFAEKNNPEGKSLYRNAYRSYYFQNKHEWIEGVGAERNLAGFPDMQVPVELLDPNASSEKKALRASYERMVRQMKVDELAGIVRPAETDREGKPTGYKFALLSSSGRSLVDSDPTIKRFRAEIAMSLLSEARLVGAQGDTGSWSLSSDKTEILAMCAAAITDIALDAFNEEVVPELLELNGMDPALAPTVRHSDFKAPNLQELGAYVNGCIQAGSIQRSEKLEEHLLEVADLPKPEKTAFPELGGRRDEGAAPGAGATPAAAAGEVGAGGAGEQNVQQLALNGAQVTSLLEIADRVATRRLPRDSALQMIQLAFNVDAATADRALGSVGRTWFAEAGPADPASAPAFGNSRV